MSMFNRLMWGFDDDNSQSKWRRFLGAGIAVGAAAIALRADLSNRAAIACSIVLAGASLFVGVLLGFLFGIPKTLRGKGDTATEIDYQSNTNLEEISDWLTKMLVGVGLVELNRVPDLIDSLGRYWEGCFGPACPRAYAAGLIVYFSVVGFLLGYLWTRLALVGDFIEKDPKRLISLLLQKVAAAAQSDPAVGERSAERQVVTATQIEAAQALQAISSTSRVSLDDMRQQIKSLAAQYESLRAAMPSGSERTRRMEIVAGQMRTFSLAAYPLLSELTRSDSPGERLAAVTFLQSRPSLAYFDWLAERLNPKVETPFIGYHAAVALLNAARNASEADRSALEASIATALSYTSDLSELTDRRSVLLAAQKALGKTA